MAIQGYDKTSTYSSIATGNVIEASYFTNEFAELFAAFAKTSSTTSTGHRHDGGDAMGGYTALLSDSDNDTKISMETISISSGAPSYTDSDTITIIAGSATIATIDSGDINVAANKGITFGDDGEKIEGDGTDLTITGNNINLTATADVNIPSGVGITFATAEKIESDGTDLSITVGSNGDINIPANIGLTFGDDGEKIEGDGTDLTIAGNNINLTAVADVVIPANVGITFGTGEKIEGDSTDLTVTSGADINLTATADVNIPSGVGITFGDDGEKIEGNGTDLTVSASADLNLTATTDINIPANVGLTFGDDGEKIEGDGTDLTVNASADLNLTATTDINIPANVGLTFGDDGEKIEGDGTDLTVSASADLNLTATTDINIPANVGLTFGDDGEKIEGDGTDLTIASSAVMTLDAGGNITVDADGGTITFSDAGSSLGTVTSAGFTGNVVGNVTGNTSGTAATVTTAAQTNITSLGTLTALTVDDVAVNGKVITMTGSSSDTAVLTAGTNGTLSIVTTDAAAAAANITITADGTFEADGTTITLDSAGDIVLDAGGANVTFKDDGTAIGDFSNSSSDFVITSSVQDKDIIFKGDDNASAITALTLDMSEAGAATFNNAITSGAVITSGAGLVIADAGNIGSASDTDAIAIASNGVVTFSQVPVLPNNTIETADIQDNAVTLAKMAGLARGKLIIGNASGDPTALAAGSANYVLTSDGTDIAWAEAASSGGGSDPDSADGDSLGTASAEWSDLYLADGGIIYFGNDQDVTVTHDPDDGLFLKSIATGDDNPFLLTLQTGETDIAANDVIGKVAFQAPDEGTGTDAILVAAAIQARSEGDFAADANATSIDFMTGASEAAATKWSITSAGTFLNAGTNKIDMNAGELILDADADTSITADTDDQIDIRVGGTDVITLTNSSLVLKGATPTITIGDAGAEDTKIVFDGNAQDYYVGLDDTDDDFKIGLGSTVGTTAHIVIDETGAVTKPLQPAVLAYSDTVANVSGDGTAYSNTNFANEVFDRNADFNNTTFTFTAPVTGVYWCSLKANIGGSASDNTRATARIVASNRDIILFDLHGYNISQPDPAFRTAGGSLIDMDVNDTLFIRFYSYNGSKVVDWMSNSFLSIYLVA